MLMKIIIILYVILYNMFSQMLKRSKKQRQAMQIKKLDRGNSQKDMSVNNSASIIPLDQSIQEESSEQHLSVSYSTPSSNLIKIQPSRTLNFEQQQYDEQQQSQQKKQQQINYHIISHTQSRKLEDVKEEEEQDRKQVKETATTFNESVQQKRKEDSMPKSKQQKIITQHYQYNEGTENQSESEGSQQYQEEPKMKMVRLQKTFVAQSFQDLIFGQIPPGCTVTCAVNFNHEFLSMNRNYDLYLVKQKKYLISASRKRLTFTSQFNFRKKKDKSQTCFGQLKSNFTGLEYIVNRVYHKNQERQSTQICWIGYDSNIFGLSNQRNITVLKNVGVKLQKIPFFSQIKNYYQNGVTSKFQKLINRKAVKNKLGQYQLDFHGKVKSPSKVNFILTTLADKECLIFGKRNDSTYILQIGHPFSIFQGFAISVSNLDHKICVR